MGAHWTSRWLGRPWVRGVHQCEDFVADVLRGQFGLAVPRDLRSEDDRAWDLQLGRHRALHWRRVDHVVDGDAVLMSASGLGRRRFWHVGVYTAGPPKSVLHCPIDGESVCQPIHELEAHGLSLEGFYRWRG